MAASAPAVPGRPRPATVTVAGSLLYLFAALIVIDAILSLVIMPKVVDAARDAYSQVPSIADKADSLANVVRAVSIGSAVLYVLLAAGVAVLGMLNMRGNNTGRVLTWVFGGIGVLCCGCGAIGNSLATGGLTSQFNTSTDPAMSDAQQKIQDAAPSWQHPATLTISILGLLALVLVIVLISLPASNAYFRKVEPQWMPAGYGDPAYPSVPGYAPPAYPTGGGYPPAPPQSGPPAPPQYGQPEPPPGQPGMAPPPGGQGQPPSGWPPAS